VAYVTRAEVKAILGIATGNTSRDAWIDALIPAAEAAVIRFCRRDFYAAKQHLEYYSGSGTNRLVLKQSPVVAVLGVWEDNQAQGGSSDDAFADETLLTLGEDYVLELQGSSVYPASAYVSTTGVPNTQPPLILSGVVVRLGTVWPSLTRHVSSGWLAGASVAHQGNIKVVYTAGDVPEDIKAATAMLIGRLMRVAPIGGDNLTHEQIKDYQYTIGGLADGQVMIGSIQAILASHRRLSGSIV
jgi:hypothetical protein